VTNRWRQILIAALVLLPLVALLAWMARAQTGGSPTAATDPAPRRASPAVPVVLAPVGQGTNNVALDVLGSGMAARSVTLFPAAAGEVMELTVRAGQRVKADQVLLRLDDRQQRLAVDLAAAQLEAAQRLQARYEATRGTGAVPGSIIDEADSGVRLAEINLRQAREALADRTLRAPFAGVVGLAQVERGDRVATDTAITTLDDRRVLQVAFELPELYAARLRTGQALKVSNPAFGGREFAGHIAQIDSRVDATSRALRLRADIPNPDDLLRPGMSFQLQLTLPGQTYVAAPELALQWGREGSFVWAVREGKAVQVPVRLVRREEGRVLLEGTLQQGEQVVVEGVQRLCEGAAVEALNTAATAPASRPASAAAAAGHMPRPAAP
jgi:membrane fusion protein, multidrug efflux system